MPAVRSFFLFSALAISASAQAAESWATEEVRISSDPGVVLAGTLRRPVTSQSARSPTLVFFWGSGPSGRIGLSPFMERLLNDGIAVLEYDKRGVGQSTGQFVDTLRNMETDAAAVVAYLRSRKDVDPARIAVAGLSQGGAVGPAVAAKDPNIAAVVMFAGPAATIDTRGPVNLIVMRDMLAKVGMQAPAIKRIEDASQRLFEAQGRSAAASEIKELEEGVVRAFVDGGFPRPQAEGALNTLNSIVGEARNAKFGETLSKVRAPVLALYGSADTVVAPEPNIASAKTALAGNRDATVVEVPDITHGFRHETNISEAEQKYAGPIAAPEVIDMVARWLKQRLR